MVKRIKLNQQGFSLIEVMIALAIFGVYATAMISTLSNNLSGSMIMSADLTLHNLAELKMNEVLLDKKEFTEATKNNPDTGAFEIEGFEKYTYSVLIKPTKFPDFSKIMGRDDSESTDSENKAEGIQKMIFDKMKKNIEAVIWQVNVTVTNSEDGSEYSLNSWINKSNAKLDLNFSL